VISIILTAKAYAKEISHSHSVCNSREVVHHKKKGEPIKKQKRPNQKSMESQISDQFERPDAILAWEKRGSYETKTGPITNI